MKRAIHVSFQDGGNDDTCRTGSGAFIFTRSSLVRRVARALLARCHFHSSSSSTSSPGLQSDLRTRSIESEAVKKDKKTTINQIESTLECDINDNSFQTTVCLDKHMRWKKKHDMEKVWRVDGRGSANGRLKACTPFCVILLKCALIWPQSTKQHSFCSGSETLKPSYVHQIALITKKTTLLICCSGTVVTHGSERGGELTGAHNNFERRPWLRQEYLTPQPCTAMAPDKGTFLMICEQPVKSHFKGVKLLHFQSLGERLLGQLAIISEYHYPLKAASPKGVTFSLIGLTLRHGTAQCRKKCPTWICKFVLACKFDHSMSSYSSLNYVMSASSLTDMPVAPHPVGSRQISSIIILE
ncbi:hypothetical protein Bca52824_021955 [Brassica carinata]|uniref:Uncharacterized protein n=1 Tax=Brassica carinata TaxID=52824 RepID=A0A8X7VF82_BRACI|nr:hypothetical protein Bca52824_021955 [Brassica carinata]